MSAPWYVVTANPRSDAAWELFHENSKRGRGDGTVTPHSQTPAPDFGGFPFLALAAPDSGGHSTKPSPTGAGAEPTPLPAFASLLAAGCRPLVDADPISAFVVIEAVETLPRGIAWFDAAANGLRLVRSNIGTRQFERALALPVTRPDPAALILFAADLAGATARAGERGYRDALISAGRHLAALEAASGSAGLSLDPLDFHDREIDALLYLDGLARSVLAVVAVAAAGT